MKQERTIVEITCDLCGIEHNPQGDSPVILSAYYLNGMLVDLCPECRNEVGVVTAFLSKLWSMAINITYIEEY